MFEGLLQARVVLKALLSRNGNLNEAVNSIRNIPPSGFEVFTGHFGLCLVLSALIPLKLLYRHNAANLRERVNADPHVRGAGWRQHISAVSSLTR